MVRLLCILSALGFLMHHQAVVAEEDSALSLGRSIYEHGIGRDGREVNATLHGNLILKGTAMACINCHGENGRGGRESFIRAADIRWANLSKPYASRNMGGAELPYDQESFAKGVRAGISASGRKFDPAMPRFDLADDEILSLIEYLSRIDHTSHSDGSRFSILGLLPEPGSNVLADALASELKNCPAREDGAPIAAVNIVYFDSPSDAILKLEKQLAKNPNALVLAPFLVGWERQYAEAVRRLNLQTVLPFSLLDAPVGSNWKFYFPGLQAQILALIKLIKQEGYSYLRIQYDSGNKLSTQLNEFSREIASLHQIKVLNGVSPPAKTQQERIRSAWLWLKPVVMEKIENVSELDELMLIPALYFPSRNLETGAQLSNRRIAYPYKPIDNSGIWRVPASIWGKAACEFLLRVGERSINPQDLPEVLRLEEGFFLYKQPALDLSSEQVFVYKSLTPDAQ